MTIPWQFASLYDRHEIFVWSTCLLDLGTDFLVGNKERVWSILTPRYFKEVLKRVLLPPKFAESLFTRLGRD